MHLYVFRSGQVRHPNSNLSGHHEVERGRARKTCEKAYYYSSQSRLSDISFLKLRLFRGRVFIVTVAVINTTECWAMVAPSRRLNMRARPSMSAHPHGFAQGRGCALGNPLLRENTYFID